MKPHHIGLLALCALSSGPSHGKGIDTFLPPAFPHARIDTTYTVTAEPHVPPPSLYIEAPRDHFVPHPPLRPTTASHIWTLARHLLGGPDGTAPPPGIGGAPALHDPVSGTAIGPFGEAYATSGPMGTGIAPRQ